MERRHHRLARGAPRGEQPERDLQDLASRIRRLVLHRGFDRSKVASPLLKRLTPARTSSDAVGLEADLHERLRTAGLDAKAMSYLAQNVEAELDLARLRLT